MVLVSKRYFLLEYYRCSNHHHFNLLLSLPSERTRRFIVGWYDNWSRVLTSDCSYRSCIRLFRSVFNCPGLGLFASLIECKRSWGVIRACRPPHRFIKSPLRSLHLCAPGHNSCTPQINAIVVFVANKAIVGSACTCFQLPRNRLRKSGVLTFTQFAIHVVLATCSVHYIQLYLAQSKRKHPHH